jgi:multiple sugar transport system substrate-binding protein
MSALNARIDRRGMLRGAARYGAAAAAGAWALDALAACGDSGGSGSKLELLAWEQFPNEQKTYQNLTKDFDQKHGIHTEFTLYPGFQNFATKLQARFAAGDPPDVLATSVAYAWDYAHNHQTLDLSKYVEKLDADKYFMNVSRPVRYPDGKGALHAFPFEWVCSVLYYNKDLFDKAHVPYPTESWTYDDLLAAAKELTGPGQWGVESYYAHTFLDAMIVANGGKVIDDAYKKCVLDQPEALASIQWAVDLIHKHRVAPPPDTSQNAGLEAAGPFQSGKIAMQIDGAWGIQKVKSVSFDWDIAMVPKGKVARVVYGGPDSFGISAKTKNPDLAWELVDLLTGPGRPVHTYEAGVVPFVKSAASDPKWSDIGRPYNKKVILDSAPYVQGAEFGHNWSKWRLDTMNQGLAPAFINGQSVSATVRKTAQDVTSVLSQGF